VSTTTIRIDDELKAKVAAAEREGKTPHAFIVEAIARQVEQGEQDAEFHRVADARWAKVLKSGKTVPWDKGRVYLGARARGPRRAGRRHASSIAEAHRRVARIELAPARGARAT
jgi:predicted transcriptional regulator